MRAFALLTILLLAGCSSPDDGGSTDTVPEGDEAARASGDFPPEPPRVLRQTYDLHISEANTAGIRTGLPPFLGVPAENCLGLAAGVKILEGFANATWVPQSLAAAELLLALDYGPGERAMTEGTSILVLDLAGLTTGSVQSIGGTGGDGFQGSLLTVNLAGDGGAAVDQKVRLDLWLRYEAGEDLVPQTGFTCSPFTLPSGPAVTSAVP